MTKAKKFIQKYDGPFNWSKIILRGERLVSTTRFGIDLSTPELRPLRIHLATDKGLGRYGRVYCPCDASSTALYPHHEDYGSIVRLIVEDDFEIRIMHMDPLTDIRPSVLDEILLGKPLKAGALIGHAGESGTSLGHHTHVEVVSTGERSMILDEVMDAQNIPKCPLSEAEIIKDIRNKKNISDSEIGFYLSLYHSEIQKRGIIEMGYHHALKSDSRFGGKIKSWYNSALISI